MPRAALFSLSSLAFCLGAGDLRAQSSLFAAPDFRGATGALYAGWDDFTSATTANTPDRPGSASTGFSFTQLDPSAFITSSGNLYSFSTTLSHRIDVTDLAGAPASVVLQTRTVGSVIDLATVKLEYLDGSTWVLAETPSVSLLFTETTPSPGFGDTVDEVRRFTWQLSHVSANALRLTFQATGTSQSFQAAALDLAPPASEPADAYATWLAARFSATDLGNPLRSGPSADPDGDGLPNLLEYALDGEPLNSASAPAPTLALSSSTLALNFPRRADPALHYAVVASDDLATWEETPVFVSTGETNSSGPAIALDRVALGAAHPRRFLRLVVTRP